MTVAEMTRKIDQTKEDAGSMLIAAGALRRQGFPVAAEELEFTALELLGEIA